MSARPRIKVDAEDRDVLGRVLVTVLVLVAAPLALGFEVRLFLIASGLGG
ncbi:MAG: hypothetical protein M3O91_03780 [Chloroflexota bacterium]|nr:hypothetical protein [Chloroflexota bacterium]